MGAYKTVVVVLEIIWAISLVNLCSRRDIEIHTKLSWTVALLVLNFSGSIIYYIWLARRKNETGSDSQPSN